MSEYFSWEGREQRWLTKGTGGEEKGKQRKGEGNRFTELILKNFNVITKSLLENREDGLDSAEKLI